MKKKEAEMLAKEKVDIIMQSITKLLEEPTRVLARMNFSSVKVEGKSMATVNIYVPENDYEEHLKLDITNDHTNVIFKEFLKRVISEVLPHETIGASRFYMFRSNTDSFDGIRIVNAKGSEIKVNMYGIDKNISDEYNLKYEEYVRKINNVNER